MLAYPAPRQHGSFASQSNDDATNAASYEFVRAFLRVFDTLRTAIPVMVSASLSFGTK